MSVTYTYNPNWINRDTQPDGSDLRVVRAADFETEWVSIQAAFSACAPAANAVLTGTITGESLTLSGTLTASGYNDSNWNTAFGWGDHSVAGYLTSVDAPASDGTGATGTWGINITGNAVTANTATTANNALACSGNAATANTATTANNALACSGNAATATTADAAYQAGTATNCSRSVVAGTNLSGGGALTANRTLDLVAEPSLTSVVLGSWKIYDSGTALYFQYNGNNVFRIDSSGNIVAEANVTAYQSV